MEGNALSSKSPSEILALYQRYRGGESVRLLLDEYGLEEVAEARFYLLFSKVRINDLNCIVCGDSPMLANLPSKAKPIEQILHSCKNCGHIVTANIEGNEIVPLKDCKCTHCSDARKQENERQATSFVDKIRKAYKDQPALSHQDIGEIALAELVGLYALLNTWAAEDLTHLVPFQEKQELFWPSKDKAMSSLSDIYRCHLLQVDLNHSSTRAFVENEDGKISWYTVEAALLPSIRRNDEFCMDILETQNYLAGLFPSGLTIQQKGELPILMRTIAVNECVQYMQYMLDEYGFDSVTGEKTEKIFEELLNDLPVNQILVCIWSAVKNAAAFMQTPHCKGRKHAYNSIQGKLRELAQRRIVGEIDSPGFDRNKYCPRSEISFALYGVMGFEEDIGFDTILSDIRISDEWEVSEEDESSQEFDYLHFTEEELASLESHGFEVFARFDATLNFIFSDVQIQIFKVNNGPTFFEMSARAGADGEWSTARFETFSALVVYLEAFDKSNQLAEMLGQ